MWLYIFILRERARRRILGYQGGSMCFICQYLSVFMELQDLISLKKSKIMQWHQSLLCLLLGTASCAFLPQPRSNSERRRLESAGHLIRPANPSRLAFAGRSTMPYSSAISAHQTYGYRNQNTNDRSSSSSRDQNDTFFPASDYDNIYDLLEAAADVLSSGGSLPTASIWSRLARLMLQRQPYQKQKEQTTDILKLQIGAIFKYTMRSFDAA
jgi:hypothetical protein